MSPHLVTSPGNLKIIKQEKMRKFPSAKRFSLTQRTMPYLANCNCPAFAIWIPMQIVIIVLKNVSKLLIFASLRQTYIIGHYNPSVRIIDLVSHTTYVVCANFIHMWWDLQFKVGSEIQIFGKTFHGKKSAERKSTKKYSLYFVFMSGLGFELWLYV